MKCDSKALIHFFFFFYNVMDSWFVLIDLSHLSRQFFFFIKSTTFTFSLKEAHKWLLFSHLITHRISIALRTKIPRTEDNAMSWQPTNQDDFQVTPEWYLMGHGDNSPGRNWLGQCEVLSYSSEWQATSMNELFIYRTLNLAFLNHS